MPCSGFEEEIKSPVCETQMRIEGIMVRHQRVTSRMHEAVHTGRTELVHYPNVSWLGPCTRILANHLFSDVVHGVTNSRVYFVVCSGRLRRTKSQQYYPDTPFSRSSAIVNG